MLKLRQLELHLPDASLTTGLGRSRVLQGREICKNMRSRQSGTGKDSAEPAGYSLIVIAGLTSIGVSWASLMEIRETAIAPLDGEKATISPETSKRA
jgi:hypothetical protein